MTVKMVISVILAVIGIVGAALSVAMLISAIRFSEWGRVVLYSVTLAVCVEFAVMNILSLKPNKSEE